MLSNPRRGGWGYRFVFEKPNGEQETDDRQGEGHANATINQMEVKAVSEALKEIQGKGVKFDVDGLSKVVVFSDSLYVVNNWRNAMFAWPPDWHGKDGQPIENAPEWKDFNSQYKRLRARGVRIEIKHARGHNSLNPHNKAADRLARAAAESATTAQLRPTSPGRKLVARKVEQGSVPAQGQTMLIRVISHRFNPVTRTDSVTYEVVDRESPYYGLADRAVTTDLLSRWATYRVRMNSVASNPRIVEVLARIESEEIEPKGVKTAE